MKSKSRRSTVYFENKDQLKPLVATLEERGYVKSYEDSWMFYEVKEINSSGFDKIKKVENEDELKRYLDVFDRSHQSDDPQNPYGILGDYLKVTETAWYKHNKANRLEYFIAYKDDQPVAVATLNNFNDIGYISNVGSLREVRGEGYGKLITLYCVQSSRNHGNTTHCLATEEGTYPNEFYKRIGFVTHFTSLGYVLENGSN